MSRGLNEKLHTDQVIAKLMLRILAVIFCVSLHIRCAVLMVPGSCMADMN